MATLFTIGHSNHPIARFIDLLQAHGVAAVADVRSVPFSRRHPQFSQRALADSLDAAGIDYLALGDGLGARPRDPACVVDGHVDYDRIAARPAFALALDRVKAEAASRPITLMCAEREPLDCHRSVLVCRHLRGAIPAIAHIHGDGAVEPHAALERRMAEVLGVAPPPLLADPAAWEAAIEAAYRRKAAEMTGMR